MQYTALAVLSVNSVSKKNKKTASCPCLAVLLILTQMHICMQASQIQTCPRENAAHTTCLKCIIAVASIKCMHKYKHMKTDQMDWDIERDTLHLHQCFHIRNRMWRVTFWHTTITVKQTMNRHHMRLTREAGTTSGCTVREVNKHTGHTERETSTPYVYTWMLTIVIYRTFILQYGSNAGTGPELHLLLLNGKEKYINNFFLHAFKRNLITKCLLFIIY